MLSVVDLFGFEKMEVSVRGIEGNSTLVILPGDAVLQTSTLLCTSIIRHSLVLRTDVRLQRLSDYPVFLSTVEHGECISEAGKISDSEDVELYCHIRL